MEVDQTNVSDGPEKESGAEVQEQGGDKVAYETYKRLLSEKKKRDGEVRELREEFAGLSEELNSYKQKELEQQGKQSELIQSLRQQIAEREKELKETRANYAWTTVASQIKAEAAREGCVNADKLLNLIPKEDLNAIQVDSSYRVNTDDLKMLMEKARRENDFMFTKKRGVNDMVPGSASMVDVKKDLKQLTNEEIIAQLKSLK